MITKMINGYKNDCVQSYDWEIIVKDLEQIKTKIEEIWHNWDTNMNYDEDDLIQDFQNLVGDEDGK